MRKRLLLGVTTLAALTIGGAAGAHEVKHESSVRMHYANDEFAGKVNSTADRCEANRTVRIFLVEGDEKTLVAQGTTDDNGFYSIAHEDAAEGEYYARVTREVLKDTQAHSHVCAGDNSPTVRVNTPPEPSAR